MQAAGSSEQIKGVYVAQITEDGELAALSGSNQYSVSDKIIRGGVRIQKRDLETKDTKPQGGATYFTLWKIPLRRKQRPRGIFDGRCKTD